MVSEATCDAGAVEGMRRFVELLDSTPSLRGAQQEMTVGSPHVAAVALAERAGVDPSDPEPQVAAMAIVGLWKIQFHALRKHAGSSDSPGEKLDAVIGEVHGPPA